MSTVRSRLGATFFIIFCVLAIMLTPVLVEVAALLQSRRVATIELYWMDEGSDSSIYLWDTNQEQEKRRNWYQENRKELILDYLERIGKGYWI